MSEKTDELTIEEWVFPERGHLWMLAYEDDEKDEQPAQDMVKLKVDIPRRLMQRLHKEARSQQIPFDELVIDLLERNFERI